MLQRMKDLGEQLSTKASETVDGITTTVKAGVGSLTDAATGAAVALNDKAVRAAVEQMRTILEVAAEELRQRPLPQSPVTITASVNLGVTALEMQVVLASDGSEGDQDGSGPENPGALQIRRSERPG